MKNKKIELNGITVVTGENIMSKDFYESFTIDNVNIAYYDFFNEEFETLFKGFPNYFVFNFDKLLEKLHPNQQVEIVERIIKFHSKAKVNILIKTHSPYVVEAVSAYSKKYFCENKCKFYQIKDQEDGNFEILDLTDSQNTIYNDFADALRKLERLRMELESDIMYN